MNYANIKYNDIANGEGVRVSLFVSGCTHHCKNCFNKETWDFSYGKPFTKDVEDKIISALNFEHVNGLTLLGGEPMEIANQKGLLPFLKRVKEIYPNKSIWCYTGYLFDDLLGGKIRIKDENETSFLQPLVQRAYCDDTLELLKYIDIIVDGEFREELKDITLRFKGSSNQRVIDVQNTLKENHIVYSKFNNKKVKEFQLEI